MVALAILWVIVLVQGAVLIEMLRQLGQIKARLPRQGSAAVPDEGILAGIPVPDLSAIPSLAGKPLGLDRGSYLVLFLTPDCVTCRELASGIADLDLEIGAPVANVVRGDYQSVDAFARDHKLPRRTTAADVDGRITASFNIKASPSAIVVRDGLSLGHGIVNTPDQAAAFYDLATSKVAEEVSA